MLSVSEGSVMGVIGVSFVFKSFLRRWEFEGPEEVVSFFEVCSNCFDFVDQVFNADNTLLVKSSFNNAVVGKGNSRIVGLSKSSFVNQLSDGFGRGVSIGNVWFYNSNHVDGGFVKSDEDSVVKLSESEKLHNLLALGIKFIDTIF